MLNRDKNQKSGDQSGVVSLLVVSIMSVVLALVSVGFAHLMDRELRQSLDRELSAQAYYSAESGLNDALNYLKSLPLNGPDPSFAGCSPSNGANSFFATSNDISSGVGAAKISCISVDANPTALLYDLKAGQSVTAKITLPQMSQMFFGWQNQSYSGSPQGLSGTVGILPQESTLPANDTGLLRVALYPILSGATNTTNDALASLSRNYFLYPNDGNGTAGSINYLSGGYNPLSGLTGNNGSFVAGNCNISAPNPVTKSTVAASFCNASISGLNGGAPTYYLQLTAEYAPLTVSVQAISGNGKAGPLSFSQVQGVVDITGTGSDVLQRIRARIDLSNEYQTPSYGVQSMAGICKGYKIYLDQFSYGSPELFSGINDDGACTPPGGGGPIVGGGLNPH